MGTRAAFAMIALLTGAACTSTTEPASNPHFLTASETRALLSRVNGVRLYPKRFQTEAKSSEAQRGYYAQKCTVLDNAVRCTAYWVGAYLLTTIGVGTCVGSIGLGCAGGILAAGYGWDVWASYKPEPPPLNRNDPWGWN